MKISHLISSGLAVLMFVGTLGTFQNAWANEEDHYRGPDVVMTVCKYNKKHGNFTLRGFDASNKYLDNWLQEYRGGSCAKVLSGLAGKGFYVTSEDIRYGTMTCKFQRNHQNIPR